MLLIECPGAARREDSEFTYGGQAHIVRPSPAESPATAHWAEYLFMRTKPAQACTASNGSTRPVAVSGSTWSATPSAIDPARVPVRRTGLG